MPKQEKSFTARHVDEQFERYMQAEFPPLDTASTPNSRVVNDLRSLYGEQIQQEQESLERMRQRLVLAVAARQQKEHQEAHGGISAIHEVAKMPETRMPVRLLRPQRPWLKLLERGLVALLVMAIVAGWVALSHWPHTTSGSQGGFNDASATPLGEPVSTSQGNFSSVYEWSSDSRTLLFLQVDTQKNELEMHMLDVASGHTTIYPVLDPSWISVLSAHNPFQILMGRYLLAVRAQGNNQATMVIWDIIGQHAITTQTLPAQIGVDRQVLSPQFTASDNEQKLVIYLLDGTITIWDTASGQKSISCEGNRPGASNRVVDPRFQWYNHDQDLLFFGTDPGGDFRFGGCDAVTGKSLFNSVIRSNGHSAPSVSPDNRYLAVSLGSMYTITTSRGMATSYHAGTIEILDAHSGQILHTHHLDKSSQTATGFFWLPDSQRLLLEDIHYSNSTNSLSPPVSLVQVSIWNAFTDQTTFLVSSSQNTLYERTSDGRYLMLSTPDMRSMDIWQTSNGQKIAIIETPGVYNTADSFFYTNDQQMLIGQKGNFDIWDIATGKLLYKYYGSPPFSIAGVSSSTVFWSPDGKYLAMMAGNGAPLRKGMLSIWRIP